MKDWATLRERYLRDSLAVRLGGLAANLRRIRSFAGRDENREAVEGLIDESKFFIEWTASEAAVDTAAELVQLQIQLARWQCQWGKIWSDTARRKQIAEQSLIWSERVLSLSGLLSS
jgi:hypothetical protein